jgi:ABC-type multidrug transport system fused ATPase/permease subunit
MSIESRSMVWRVLSGPLRASRRAFVTVTILAALAAAADLVEPLIYREAINDVAGLFVRSAYEKAGASGHEDADTRKAHTTRLVAARTPDQALRTLLIAVALLSLTTAVSRILSLAANNIAAVAVSGIEENFIYRTFAHVLRLPIAYFSRRSTGTIAQRIDQSDQVGPLIGAFIEDLIPHLISLVGMLIVMFTQNVLLTCIALATVPPYLLVARLSTKRLEKNATEYFEQWDAVSAQIQETVGAVKTVKLSGAETREVQRLTAVSSSAYRAYLGRTKLENRFINWQGFLTQISEALILGVGGYLVLKHQLTPGDVVMFVSYVGRVFEPIDNLTSLATNVQEHIVSVSRAAKLLETGSEEAAGAALVVTAGRVEFRDVHFGYTPARKALNGLSFALEPRTTTALVGPSGAGKTTAADLLLRLYQPWQGEILIDGQALRTLDPSSVRAAVGVVAVDGAVFRGTLASNIRYKRPEASDEEVHAAALAAGLSRTLERLPDGLATEVGERGVGLSMGERQRVQIARVLASKPHILVLDEATANLDHATETEVKHALGVLRSTSTTLIIAHRYSMVRDADRVLVLEAGAVIEEGTPAELIAKGGWFAALAAGHPEDEAEAGGENGTDTGEVAEADGEQDSDELATGDDDEDSADGADEEPDDDADEEDPDDDADRDADEEEPDDDADEEEAAEPAADADAPAVRDVPPASKPRVKPPRRR